MDTYRDSIGETLLHEASEAGHAKIVEVSTDEFPSAFVTDPLRFFCAMELTCMLLTMPVRLHCTKLHITENSKSLRW